MTAKEAISKEKLIEKKKNIVPIFKFLSMGDYHCLVSCPIISPKL